MKRRGVPREAGRANAARLMLVVTATVIALAACGNRAPGPTPSRPPRPLPGLALDDSLRPTLLAVGRAVLDDALSSTKDTAAVCVIFVWPGRGEYRPDPTDLRVLAESADRRDLQRRFISITDCPKTYESMILTVDADGRRVDPAPQGYVDPHLLRIDVPERWDPKSGERSITVMVRVSQGTGTDEYLCRVRPSSAAAAMLRTEGTIRRLRETATCRLERRLIS